jgi:signal transduction histidine kinase
MLDKELRAKNNILKFNIADDCILRSDPQRITQVLLNMITNANKYSSDGIISISVRDSECSGITISVEDQGIGMTEREIRIAMSDFGRVNNPHLASTNQGIGLGLPISNRIMRLLGGELSIWSEKGVGTRVDLIFPSNTIIKRELLDQKSLAGTARP